MKVFYFLRAFWLIITCCILTQVTFSQCPVGWGGTATLKWDNRFYLINTGSYTYNNAVTAAMCVTQRFTLGSNAVAITRGSGISSTGRNTTITAVSGSYGSGYSVNFSGNDVLTLSFDTVVANLQFSLYDIDNSQTAKVTAVDGSGNPLNVTMSLAQTGIITLGGTATAPVATSSNTNSTGTGSDNKGTVNVQVNGFSPSGTGVKTVTITLGGTAGDFWLSDISACVYKPFPTSYYVVAKPYTGQPAYILNNSSAPTISTTDVNTGKCRYVFTDNAVGNPYLNSLGYDPYKHFLYYVPDGMARSGSYSTNRTIKKYDFNTLTTSTSTMGSGTVSTLIANISSAPWNIPVFDQGVESGAASFYAGSYYIGIEGANSVVKIGSNYNNSGRVSMIWRIDFDASGNPVSASQAFCFPADNGGGRALHNWSDFSISNGILYDFNSANGGQYTHCDLQSGLILNTYAALNSDPSPGQSGTAWNENIYWLAGGGDNDMALYNKNGTVASPQYDFTGKASIDWTGSAGSGDGSDAFKPPLDYGDAPASYDPASGDPAVHDFDSTIRFGNYWNAEFAKKTSADATGDGVTDDGLPSPPVFTNAQTNYSATVQVYNHSGSPVTVAGWIDLNNDGVFSSYEGVSVTVNTSSTSLQNVYLSWSGKPYIPAGLFRVFLRIRVTSASNGMTASNPTGYYGDGEVEDYVINVSQVLQTNLVSFNANAVNGQYVKAVWQTAGEQNVQSYLVQRSKDGTVWDDVQSIASHNGGDSIDNYSITDQDPLPGISYYRLKSIGYTGNYEYSTISKVMLRSGSFSFTLTPNPFKSNLSLTLAMDKAGPVLVRLVDAYGNVVYTGSFQGNQGTNSINLTGMPDLAKGIYILEVSNGQGTQRSKVLKE